MDNIANVPGVTNTTTVIPGSSTPAPYNAPLVGLTDGNNLGSASKNMAMIYNMLNHEIVSVIKAAGITPNINNWAQLAQAIQIIAAGGSNALSNHLTNAVTDHPMFALRDDFIGLPFHSPSGVIPAHGLAANGASFSAATYPKLAQKYPSLVLPNIIDGRTLIQALSGFNTDSTGDVKSHLHQQYFPAVNAGGLAYSASGVNTIIGDGPATGGAANLAAGLKGAFWIFAR